MLLCLSCFETGACVTQAGFQLDVYPPQCLSARITGMLPCPVFVALETESGASCVLHKYSTKHDIFLVPVLVCVTKLLKWGSSLEEE